MADFKISERLTSINEGGYSNNPNDRGGETYAGIARNFWGKWLGWKYIDKYKQDYKKAKTSLTLAQWINASATVKSEPVEELVSEFYRVNFWELNRLGEFKCQQLANTVYDFGVNSGKGRAVRFLQEVLEVSADGVIGRQTITTANCKDCKSIYNAYNKKREEFYKSIAVGSQKQFLKSWLSRLHPYKD